MSVWVTVGQDSGDKGQLMIVLKSPQEAPPEFTRGGTVEESRSDIFHLPKHHQTVNVARAMLLIPRYLSNGKQRRS